MKFKRKNTSKTSLSEKIANALTLKPRADIEDDLVFSTKPHTVSRADFSSESEDETAISDFRKRNVNLLSDISKKYEGRVVSRRYLKEQADTGSGDSEQESEEDGSLKDNFDKHGEVSQSEESDSADLVKKFTHLTKANDCDSSDDAETKTATLKKNSKLKSKQKTESDLEDESGSDGDSDDNSITQFKMQLENDDSDEKSDDDEEDYDEDDNEGYDISQMDEPPKEEFEHVKKQNVSEEAKKGASIRNQLLVWEGLLEMRIHLQRCMNTANQMPMPDTYENFKGNSEFVEECNATKANVTNVLDKFLTLQTILFKKFPETKNLSTKQIPTEAKKQSKEESDEEIPSDTDNEEIPSDTEPEDNTEKDNLNSSMKIHKQPNQTVPKKRKLEDYEKEISTSHKAFKSFRDSIIQKWNDKTRLATATNVKNTPANTVLQQISYILSDRDKLIRRTQLKRSEYDIVGYRKATEENGEQNGTDVNLGMRDRKDNDEYIPEIFDDSDFYHQLLRELIECKSADISDPVQLSRQWIALQQMRSKMKRKVDTKATKGRKIKYVVHNQLVNYMAPEKCTTWTEESTNELYSSLFGKMFEQNNIGLNNLSNLFKIK